MPRVPEARNRFGNARRVTPQRDFQQSTALQGSFGEAETQAKRGLGQAITRVGDAETRMQLIKRRKLNTAVVADHFNKFSSELDAKLVDIQQLKGDQSFEARKDYENFSAETRSKYLANLTNPVQQDTFALMAEKSIGRGRSVTDRYVSGEEDTYAHNALVATQAQHIKNGVDNLGTDPSDLAAGLAAVNASSEGVPPEQLRLKRDSYTSTFHSSVIGSMLAQDLNDNAAEYFAVHEDDLDPVTREKVRKVIDAKTLDDDVFEGVRALEGSGLSFSEMLENTDSIEDADLREGVRASLITRDTQRRNAEIRSDQDASDAVVKGIASGAYKTLSDVELELLDDLSEQAKRSLEIQMQKKERGEFVVNDDVAYHKALLSAQANPAAFADKNIRAEYGTILDTQHQESLRAAQRGIAANILAGNDPSKSKGAGVGDQNAYSDGVPKIISTISASHKLDDQEESELYQNLTNLMDERNKQGKGALTSKEIQDEVIAWLGVRAITSRRGQPELNLENISRSEAGDMLQFMAQLKDVEIGDIDLEEISTADIMGMAEIIKNEVTPSLGPDATAAEVFTRLTIQIQLADLAPDVKAQAMGYLDAGNFRSLNKLLNGLGTFDEEGDFVPEEEREFALPGVVQASGTSSIVNVLKGDFVANERPGATQAESFRAIGSGIANVASRFANSFTEGRDSYMEVAALLEEKSKEPIKPRSSFKRNR